MSTYIEVKFDSVIILYINKSFLLINKTVLQLQRYSLHFQFINLHLFHFSNNIKQYRICYEMNVIPLESLREL